ncbi:MAG: 4Fe-4S ferredoxin [Bryobacteraceae bacterium]|nr:4Fe-4S ferredoxin [Bryobacteraceae bacterium]
MDRPTMEVDIVCAGFGPASGGFLTTLARGLEGLESRVMPGMPPQVICYERADDIGFGVSGVVTRARGIKESFPEFDVTQVPMAAPVREEKLIYLLDPVGASRRPGYLRLADQFVKSMTGQAADSMEVPFVPEFLHKRDGFVLSLGQFNQWVGQQLMMGGAVQVWPGSPVAKPLIEGNAVCGIQLLDQGVEADGRPGAGYQPGMEVRAPLTVVADGPVGAVGRELDEYFGLPEGHRRDEWAVGSKMVVELRDGCRLEPGTVFHTIGYPEPEIFGFFYVHPGGLASVGIFLPSWFANPARTSYRYLQHYVRHPFLWQHLEGGKLRSWGAKSLLESGRRGEPYLCGNGYARIGEGSGSTNVLTGSGVDEAWTTGIQLAEGVLQLWKEGAPFTKENLERTYVQRRRASWLEREAAVAERARDGFQKGFARGMAGMMLAGLTKGALSWPATPKAPHEQVTDVYSFYRECITPGEIARVREECREKGQPLHDALMARAGWPEIPLDGELLVSHQDALLMGGKVQAAPGYADHVVFLDPQLCETCADRLCVEVCSGEAIHAAEGGGRPAFDREKCVHCGACVWNCSEGENIAFVAGAGGLHSSMN